LPPPNPPNIFNTRGDIVATVNQGTKLKITGKPKAEDLERVRKGEFWFKSGDQQPGLYDLYYEVEYFGRMSWRSPGQPIKGYVYTSWISLTAAAGRTVGGDDSERLDDRDPGPRSEG